MELARKGPGLRTTITPRHIALRRVLLQVLALLLLSPPVWAGSLQFSANYPAPVNAQGIVTADFNGDGIPDLAMCGQSTSILLGQANGSFTAGSTLPDTCTFSGLVTADFNGDGKPDLAIVGGGNFNIDIYLNNGDGTFALRQTITLGNTPGVLIAGDFNGDGIPDLAVEVALTPIQIFIGKGDGTFVTTPKVSGGCVQNTVAADINGDGKLDLISACNANGTVTVLLGNGDGSFQSPASIPAITNVTHVRVADFNGDGKLDIAAMSYPLNSIAILLGNGDGTFQAAKTFPLATAAAGGSANPQAFNVFDVDGDGIPDIVVASTNNNFIQVLRGRGDGTFATTGIYSTLSSPGNIVSFDVDRDGTSDLAVEDSGSNMVSVYLGSSANPVFQQPVFFNGGSANSEGVALADLNRDGMVDAVIANNGVGISFLQGIGNGSFQLPVTYSDSGGSPNSVVLADLRGVGKLDAVVAHQSSANISIFLGNGDGTFQTPPATYATGIGGLNAVVGDLRGNGKLDVVVCNDQDNTISVLLGNGDGTFQAQKTYATGVAPQLVTLADFNHDGKLDVAVMNAADQTVSILLGNGNGTLQAQKTYATGGGQPVGMAAGDLRGDGKIDLVFGSTSNIMTVLLGNGDGTFQPAVPYTDISAGIASAALIADFNGDGIPDVVIGHQNSAGVIGLFVGKGDGTFQPVQSYAAGVSPVSLAAADLNGDGRLDLVATDIANLSGTVTVLLGNMNSGSARYQPATNYAVGANPARLAVADFNNDGKDDVAVANSGSASVSILSGSGTGAFTTGPIFTTGTSTTPAAVAAGDFNRDGWPDIAVTDDPPTGTGPITFGHVFIRLNDGKGNFPTIAHTYTVGVHPRSIEARDVDGDGKLDLLVNNGDSVSVLFGNGDGSFQNPVSFAAVTPKTASRAAFIPNASGAPLTALNGMATGDLRGIGRKDMVIADASTNAVQVLLNNGNRTFATPAVSYLSGGTQTSAVAIGDVNGDGKPDIVAANFASNNITVFINNGSGVFTPGGTFSIQNAGKGQGPFDIQLLDFNGDGRLDVATVNYTDGTVSALAGNGNGTFQPATVYTVQSGPQGIRQLNVGGNRNSLATSGTGLAGGLVSILVPAVNTTVSAAASSAVFGSTPSITATVTSVSGTNVPTGTVTFSENGKVLTNGNQLPLSNGKATFTFAAPPAVGSHSILMSYSGDLAHNPSTGTATQVVTQAATTAALAVNGQLIVGATLTLVANVQGPGTPTGEVLFQDKGTTLGAANLSGGIATLPISNLAAGAHSLTAAFQGSQNYFGSISPAVPINIQKPAVIVEIASSAPSSAVSGTSVTFTATLIPAGATGTVVFGDCPGPTVCANPTQIGTPQTVPGTAQVSTTTLTVGEHTIVANYNGGTTGTFANVIASDGLIQIVNATGLTAYPSVSLASNALMINGTTQVLFRNPSSPANPGEVMFTATVTGGSSPGGNVDFYDDDVKLGSSPLTAGSASFTYNQFTIGKHRIFAVYSGDSKNGGCVSGEYDIYRDPKTR